ncbi:hypothetical protein C2S53_005209 [Perilla frutescens var. hirtella]|uniref:Uncharacterized protein n=1 Tax=Perilla frutescens var. hirtella TaxID=608512 RepID=A0AAD4PEX6_PERFH|nr:hypothetical protein C2S53_005209 [Perilla frutescens var. hirtella]
MGYPNKNFPSSEKDLHAPTTKRDKPEAAADHKSANSSSLKIRLPSRGVVDAGGDEDGGCTTPKAVDAGVVLLPKCPPPPRKPKSAPSTKRKAHRVLLDLSNEIESLFPSNLLTDFMCGKIKKVRTSI